MQDSQGAALGGVRLMGVGSAVPERCVTNHDLSQRVDTSDEWIVARTGIRQRRVIDPERDTLASLGTQAARHAIAMAGIEPAAIDLILLATSTPDDLFGTAANIQANLGATRAVAFDLSAACSGFVFGLVTASQFLRARAYQTILLIGADVLSRWVNWDDRSTCILFGDGAGAVVLQASDRDNLLGFELRSDGTGNDQLNLRFNSARQGYDAITMNGREVYRFAVNAVPEVLAKALHRAGVRAADIHCWLLHQANQRILDAVADRLEIPGDRVASNLANYGNTSAASIPIVLDEWVRAGKVAPGDLLAMAGFGAGLSWGAAIARWG